MINKWLIQILVNDGEYRHNHYVSGKELEQTDSYTIEVDGVVITFDEAIVEIRELF